jgi:hypothetical protein
LEHRDNPFGTETVRDIGSLGPGGGDEQWNVERQRCMLGRLLSSSRR